MKRRIIGMLLAVLMLTGCSQYAMPESVKESGIQTNDASESEKRPDAESGSETGTASESVPKEGCFEVALTAEPYDYLTIADAIFGAGNYMTDEQGESTFCFNDDGTLRLNGGAWLWYTNAYAYSYEALCRGDGILQFQDARLESLFPEKELPGGGRTEAEQACDALMELIGYPYTERSVYVLDADYANAVGIPSPELNLEDWYSVESVWQQDEGAYLLVYRNTQLVESGYETAFTEVNAVGTMIYSPKYGLCQINVPPNYVETDRTAVEIIDRSEVEKHLYEIFYGFGVPMEGMKVADYELVYCENAHSGEASMTRSQAIPCWKILLEDTGEKSVWEHEGTWVRNRSDKQCYLIVDARVNGNLGIFFQVVEL